MRGMLNTVYDDETVWCDGANRFHHRLNIHPHPGNWRRVQNGCHTGVFSNRFCVVGSVHRTGIVAVFNQMVFVPGNFCPPRTRTARRRVFQR